MHRLLSTPALAAAAVVSLTATAPAQQAAPPWDSVTIAWDAGRYDDALARLERLLTGPTAEGFLERAALLTGELFRTAEVAILPQARNASWSPGGRYLAVEFGPTNAARTVVWRVEGTTLTRLYEFAGGGFVFAPGDGWAAYVATGPLRVRTLTLADGREFDIASGDTRPRQLAYGPDGALYAVVDRFAQGQTVQGPGASPTRILALAAEGPPRPVTPDSPAARLTPIVAGGTLIYRVGLDRLAFHDLGTHAERVVAGGGLAVSPDGRTAAYGSRDGEQYLLVVEPVAGGERTIVVRTPQRLAAPAFSPDGARLAFQMMPREDWELFTVGLDGAPPRRLTREIQHDLFPRYLADGRVLAVMGEARHRRSYLYDVATGQRTRLFHNNLVRTVSQEYAWAASPDGSRVLIVADRDGNTVSPERGVYLTDLTQRVTVADVLARVRTALAAERDLRERGRRLFAPVAAQVRAAVADVSVARVDGYGHDLFRFDSKYITEPGNRLAIEYLERQLRSWGYEPELQWFEPRPGVRTANVVATLRGTANPDLVYVISSHFDSVRDGPGADDDASGASALLETARVLAGRPQAATIQFAFFTGEEAGLLGSREYVRRAQAGGVRIVGALNNDMIGWRNDHRLDNTIRYSNDGLRDLQHAAAIGFTDLITYDSRYYQNTDAAAYYEAYGDIVGGIGSYPILGNPHYHQVHDVLETVDPRLVAEVAKTTVASLIAMASSPSRLAGLRVETGPSGTVATWTAAPERGVVSYRVAYGPADAPNQRMVTVREPRAVLPGATADVRVAVKAVLANGLESWDWARAAASDR